MRDRTPKHDGMKLVRHIEIIDEDSIATNESIILDAFNRSANNGIR